jgi:hypothetical protein
MVRVAATYGLPLAARAPVTPGERMRLKDYGIPLAALVLSCTPGTHYHADNSTRPVCAICHPMDWRGQLDHRQNWVETHRRYMGRYDQTCGVCHEKKKGCATCHITLPKRDIR